MKFDSFGGKEKEWSVWKSKFKALAHHLKLLPLLKPGASRPTARGDARDEWDEKSEELYYKLVWCTVGTALDLVKQFEDQEDCGAKAWRGLIDKYERKDVARLSALQGELINARLGNGQDPDPFFLKLEEARRQLREMGNEVTDDTLLGTVMNHLPDSYATLRPSLRTNKGLDYETLKSEVRQHYLAEIAGQTESDGNLALYARRFNGHCHKCEMYGHRARDCKVKVSGNGSMSGGGGGSGKWKFNRGSGNGRSINNKIVCYECEERGHMKRDCPKLKSNTPNLAFTIVEENKALTVGEKKEHTWLVDSGCTSHMCETTEGLVNVRKEILEVRVAGDTTLTATGVGTMKVWASNDAGDRVNITLNDVLIVPGLGYNLLSVDRIRRYGGSIHFEEETYMELGKCYKIPITPAGGLFEVKLRPRLVMDQVPTALIPVGVLSAVEMRPDPEPVGVQQSGALPTVEGEVAQHKKARKGIEQKKGLSRFTRKQAIRSDDADHRKGAISGEIQDWTNAGARPLVERSHRANRVGIRRVYKVRKKSAWKGGS